MKQQKGATLIIVLVILLMITILGTIAVKSGILGLKIATNSQVNALLLENSDAALFGGVSKSMLTLNEAIIDVKKG